MRHHLPAVALLPLLVIVSLDRAVAEDLSGSEAWRALAQVGRSGQDEAQKEFDDAQKGYEKAHEERMRIERDIICDGKVFSIRARLAGVIDETAPSRAAYITKQDLITKAEFCKGNEQVLRVLQKLETEFMDAVQKDDGQCKTHPSWVKFAKEWSDTKKTATGYGEKICAAAR